MTTNTNNTIQTNDDSWTCPHCFKLFKKSYRYKNHLSRCLVYNEHLDTTYQLMGDMVNGLKEELVIGVKRWLFKMLNEIGDEV